MKDSRSTQKPVRSRQESPSPGEYSIPGSFYNPGGKRGVSIGPTKANLAEAWRKRLYPKHFVTKVNDAEAEAEMRTLMQQAKDEGLWALGHPKEIGGQGMPFLDYVHINEVVGRSSHAMWALGTLGLHSNYIGKWVCWEHVGTATAKTKKSRKNRNNQPSGFFRKPGFFQTLMRDSTYNFIGSFKKRLSVKNIRYYSHNFL